MNKFPPQITKKYDHKSSSNPSLITAGLPSGSIMTSRLIPPSSTTKPNYYLNQNRATDTQPISLHSPKSDTNQSITFSNRTRSDTYLNLSRKDIDDLLTALHTLAQYVHNDIDNPISRHDNESHALTMVYSKSTNHTIKSSSETNNPSRHHCHNHRHSIPNRRRSLSTDLWLHHHVLNRMCFHPVEEIQHQLYDIKRKQERRILRQLQYYQNYFHHQNSFSYPSYSSNAKLHSSTYESNIRSKPIRPCSPQSPSPVSFSSYILDKLIYIDHNEPILNVQMLPQHAHTLQILQSSHMHSFMSIDSLNTKDHLRTVLKPCHLQNIHDDRTFSMDDQLNLNKIDAATQWSLPMSSTSRNTQQNAKLDITQTNSTILTELSQSRTTIATNNSAVNNTSFISQVVTPSLINDRMIDTTDNFHLTKSETERFLTSLNLPICQCLNEKRGNLENHTKHSSTDTIPSVSFDDDLFSTSLNKKKIKQTTMKVVSKRPRHRTPKSSRNHPTTKRPRLQYHSPSNNRHLMTMMQSLKTTDLQEDSSFDFFDMDTTFSDAYDRFFSDTIISEKYIED